MAETTNPTYLTLGQIAERLNVTSHRLAYAIAQHRVRPRMRIGITRVWCEEDIPRIQAALDRIATNRGGRAVGVVG